MKYEVKYRNAPANDNYYRVCEAHEINAHVQYMLDCSISPRDIEINLLLCTCGEGIDMYGRIAHCDGCAYADR